MQNELTPREAIRCVAKAKVFIVVAAILSMPVHAFATVEYLTSGTSWKVPSCWNDGPNSIEVIGGGGGWVFGGCGGGGGAYSKATNVTLTPGATVTYSIGIAGSGGAASGYAGTTGGDTYFCSSTSNCAGISGSAVVSGAKGGSGAAVTCGTGGVAASGIGDTKYSGGTGATKTNATGVGGGGAAGPGGDGGNATGTTGGTGGAGSGGAGGNLGNNGSLGAEWGSKGSGGGAGGISSGTGRTGGLYGGGGGGGEGSTNTAGGAGKQGLVVVTYPQGCHGTVSLTNTVQVTGSVTVEGSVAKGSGTFVIDHPLDPENKLLYHSFVESPEAKNVYEGVAALDEKGVATIVLPEYFLSLNRDFRYFASSAGGAMPHLYLQHRVRKKHLFFFGPPIFSIAGGAPFGDVVWQVNATRRDRYVRENPVRVEVDKGPQELFDVGECVFAPLCDTK